MEEAGKLATSSGFLCSWFVSSVFGVPCGFLWASLQGPMRSPGVSSFLGLQGPDNKVSSDLFGSSSQFLLLPLIVPITCGGVRNVFGGGDPSPPLHTYKGLSSLQMLLSPQAVRMDLSASAQLPRHQSGRTERSGRGLRAPMCKYNSFPSLKT